MNEPYNDEATVRELYHRITLELIRRNLSITTMESCTAGLIASLITDTEGASAIMKGAFVTYSNEAKIRQGVPEEIIRRYGVYSVETAEAMAAACRSSYSADIGIGITGSFVNVDPANPDSVPGEICMAVDYRGRIDSQWKMLESRPARYAYKLAAAGCVGNMLAAILKSAESLIKM